MMRWSDEAKQLLDRALQAAGEKAAAEGADAAEVAGDLRLRAEQELAKRGGGLVSSAEVTAVLASLGVALPPPAGRPESPPPVAAPARPKTRFAASFGGVLTWFIPLAALLWEVVARAGDMDFSCRGLFFDPIPTWLHVILVATVPAVNFLGWRILRGWKLPDRWRRATRVLWGVATAVGVWYAARFVVTVPIALFGFIAIIYFGLGLLALLPLAPYFGLAGLWWHRRRFDDTSGGRGRLAGFCAGLALLVALFTWSLTTAFGIRMATSDTPEEQRRGIHFLRAWGDRQELAELCYGRARGGELGLGADFMDPFRDLSTNADELRRLYYRVHGEPYYLRPNLGRKNGLRGERTTVDVAWDNGQGGDAVGQGLRGLSLAASRLDGQVEPELGLAYLEWTLEFVNSASVEREARAQIALPPGGVVSRLTLWVNGEEREAAFSGNSQVKAAYQKVVQARRDPVLVTSCGEDRVMMQCYPVPAGGGRMKVRLGITAPLQLTTPASAALRWPIFLERNFNLARLGQHDVWIAGAPGLQADAGVEWISATNAAGRMAMHGHLPPAAVCEAAAPVQMQRPAGAALFASDDPIERGQTIVTRIGTRSTPAPGRVVFVLDASAGQREQTLDALAALPARWPGVEVAVVAAGAEEVRVLEPRAWDEGALGAVGAFAGTLPFAGGQDNAPALEKAWDLAAARADGVIFWLHGPCAEEISNSSALRQRMERSTSGPELIDLQLGAGPNRLVERLDRLAAYRPAGITSDGAAVVKHWSTARMSGQAIEIRHTREAAAPAGAEHRDSPHPARCWANEEVSRLLATHVPVDTEAAATLAARYFLVTPVSGAVVLETKEQFAEAGLEPMSGSVVTVVPEPATFLLAAIGLAAFGLRLWWRRRAA